jgi:hypothetical protein
MAYGVKYRMPFISRKNISYYVDLLLKDHELDTVVTLTGAPDPFLLNYESGDNDIINPIRAGECTVNFYNDGATPLTTFYSEDDEAWQIRLYCDDPLPDVPLWEGFLVQDDCRETFLDPPHIVQLKGTDNLALLKNVPFDKAFIPEITETNSNVLTYNEFAGTISEGRTTLGINFVSSTNTPVDFTTGNSPLQDLAGYDPTFNDDRWILKNGSTAKTFHITGTISVQFLDFGEAYRWTLQKSNATSTVIALMANTDIVRHDIPIDVTITLQAGERLFPIGYSDNDFSNNKQYFASTWTITENPQTVTTSILDKLTLFDYIKFSLIKTGLALPLSIYSNIYENTMPDRGDDPVNEMFSQTHLFSGMFLNDDGTWANCYDILEKILFPLNATLQQAGGGWKIIHWPELRSNANNGIRGTAYDETFANPAAITLAPNAPIAIGSDMIFINADATKSILRPYKNVKFTFNYQQPRELIRNINLQQEGNLIREYDDPNDTTGKTKIKEYELPHWYNAYNGSGTPPEIFLRVVSSAVPQSVDKLEIDRYIVVKGSDYGALCLRSDYFYIDTNDRVRVNLQFRDAFHRNTNDDFLFVFAADPGGASNYFGITYNVIQRLNGQWIDGGVYRYTTNTEQDMHDWASISVESLGCPVAGKFYIVLPQVNNSGGETHYKDLSVDYIPYINDTSRITGQIHTQEITANPKNKLENEIEIDDSPKLALQGALFTHELTNDEYLTLTKSWHRSGVTETRRLGEITTMEREQMQSTPRAIIEGSIDHTDPLISIMNVIQIDTLPNLNFIFGVTEFNFMESQFKATLWEIYAAGEADADMDYLFSYIYKTS